MKPVEEYDAFDEEDFVACLLYLGPPAHREKGWSKSFSKLTYINSINEFYGVRYSDRNWKGVIDFRDDYLEWIKTKLKEKENG